MHPQDILKLQLNVTTLMFEVQSVMMLRLMGMGGLIPAHHGENNRMIEEKGPALAQSFVDASYAMMTGQMPAQVMQAAVTPVSTQVRANRARLTR